MERIHMNIYKEIIYRIRAGESERNIARDMGISRPTIHKYKIKAELTLLQKVDFSEPNRA